MKQKLKIFRLIFIISLATVLTTEKALCQTPTVTDAYIISQPLSTDSTILQGTYIVELSDSNYVSNIEVKIGTMAGASDILSHTFLYDSQAGLPTGFSYARVGNKLTLGVSTYPDESTFFGQVRVQATNGTWSSPMQFITN
ncbi:MAG: hypothetical protein ABI723_00885 [Bacteroidia bacterium]